ncbi:hypothetical protein SKAU_G00035830 [Synaphobranchus kaupii]|uniref:Uncharacterized protein n=1 Tax=Synaphobranchus kaupii TaxID=118154 RepID=A0A9Q1GER8_SYNKA|nr:hypothetical protein SKAU_G00035830 [Synaphobranchus kaupii]
MFIQQDSHSASLTITPQKAYDVQPTQGAPGAPNAPCLSAPQSSANSTWGEREQMAVLFVLLQPCVPLMKVGSDTTCRQGNQSVSGCRLISLPVSLPVAGVWLLEQLREGAAYRVCLLFSRWFCAERVSFLIWNACMSLCYCCASVQAHVCACAFVCQRPYACVMVVDRPDLFKDSAAAVKQKSVHLSVSAVLFFLGCRSSNRLQEKPKW